MNLYFAGLIALTLLGIYIWFVIKKGGFSIHKERKEIGRDAVPAELHAKVLGYVENIKKIYNSIELLKDQLPGVEEFLASVKQARLLEGPMIEYLLEFQNYEFRYNALMTRTADQRKVFDAEIGKADKIAKERLGTLKMANNLIGQTANFKTYSLEKELQKLELTTVNVDEFATEYNTILSSIFNLVEQINDQISNKDILALIDSNTTLASKLMKLKLFKDKVALLVAKDAEKITNAKNGLNIIKNKISELNRNLSKPGLTQETRDRAFSVMNMIQNKIKGFTGNIKTDYKLYEELSSIIHTCENVKTEVDAHSNHNRERR